MSTRPQKMEHRLSLVEGFQADSADSECNTPQGFLYETKFVVLNYLGLVPPNLDPGYSEFDIHYESSTSATPFSVSDDDRESASSGSRRSSDHLTVNVRRRAGHSPKTSPRSRSGSSSHHASPAVTSSSMTPFPLLPPPYPNQPPLQSAAPIPTSGYSYTHTYAAASSVTTTATASNFSSSSMEVVTLESQGSFDTDLCTDSAMDGDDDSSQSHPLSEGSDELHTRDNPEIKIGTDDDSTSDSWEFRRRQRQELVEPLREEVRIAMSQLQEEFKQVVASGDCCESILPSVICPLHREALVAERIAQIGDKIMQQRGDDIERAMQMFFGSQSEENLTYGLFKSLVKQMMKSTVPGWYHLALMLKFTRHMALGLVNKGGQGFGSVTDFAVRYIEENLAQTIIDQGGWDAMTNINLEDINTEILSELSSRTPSPLPFSSQESHASESGQLEPFSPDAGTPVDSPNWKTDQQSHFTSSGDEGLNQLTEVLPAGSSPNEFTHRSRSESRPEDLASLFINESSDPVISHSVSSPSNLGTVSVNHPLGVQHGFYDDSQGSAMDVDTQPTFSVGSDGDAQESEKSGQKSGIGKMAAAVAGAAGAIFGIKKNNDTDT